MGRLLTITVWTCLLNIACESGPALRLPTGPSASPTTTTPTPTPAPTPPKTPFPPPGLATSIDVGDVVKGRVSSPPACLGGPWPCQYFVLTPPVDGTLTVELKFDSSTQNGQGVDVTVASTAAETYAQYFDKTTTRATAPVTAGTEYLITLWYTYADLEFELRTSLESK